MTPPLAPAKDKVTEPGPRSASARAAAILGGRHVLLHRAARPAQPLLRAALPAGPGWGEEARGAHRGAHHAAEVGGRIR